MQQNNKKKPRWIWPYRLVLLNDQTLGEVFSLRFTPVKAILFFTAISIFMATLLTGLIAFTPIREYIPGYGTEEERDQIRKLVVRTELLLQKTYANDSVLRIMKKIVSGQIPHEIQKKSDVSAKNTSSTQENPWVYTSLLAKETEKLKSLSDFSSKPEKISDLFLLFPATDYNTPFFMDSLQRLIFDVKKETVFFSPAEGRVILTTIKDTCWIVLVQFPDGMMMSAEGLDVCEVKTGEHIRKGDFLGVCRNGRVYFLFIRNGQMVSPADIFIFPEYPLSLIHI